LRNDSDIEGSYGRNTAISLYWKILLLAGGHNNEKIRHEESVFSFSFQVARYFILETIMRNDKAHYGIILFA